MTSPPFPHRMVHKDRLIRHDPLLGHAFVAGVHRRVPHEHGAYFATTNAEGFREDHDLAAPPEGVRVLCLGDSYAAGDGVDNRQRFMALLAEQLGIAATNVAVPGHGPDQNVLQLESGSMPPADLIVWCIAVQTIERIQSGKRLTVDRRGQLWQVDRPHFVLCEDGELELRGVPVAEQGVELLDEAEGNLDRPLAAVWSRSVAAARARLVAAIATYVKPAPDPDYQDHKSSGWRLMSALVQRFHAAAATVPVVIVPLPTSRYLTEHHEAHFQTRFAELERAQDGLHVVDVVSAMRQAPAAQRAKFHYRLDGHFTESGHAAVAAALAEQLVARKFVPASGGRSAAPIRRRPDRLLVLHVGWVLGDGYAYLCEGDAQAPVSKRRESELTGGACRSGVMPISAVHACLDAAKVAGPELGGIVLESPCSWQELAGMKRQDAGRLALLAGWIRWLGAAEMDLRTFLCFEGKVVDRELAMVPLTLVDDAADGVDDEAQWMHASVARLRAGLAEPVLKRRILRLARRWQCMTRRARESVLPTTAPLRRGRMAQRLANPLANRSASETGPAPAS